MAKRKLARFGEDHEAYECTNKNCKWQGLESEKATKRRDQYSYDDVCPKCGNNEFYGLLELKKQKS